MKTILRVLASISLLAAASCGSSSTSDVDAGGSTPDVALGAQPVLTVDNTLSWCTVVVTVGTSAPVTFSGASMTFDVTAGTTVNLSATPNPSFMPVQWTGTTTESGATATYVVGTAASQSVTACCALSDGSGC